MAQDETLEQSIETTLYHMGIHNSGQAASAVMETIKDWNAEIIAKLDKWEDENSIEHSDDQEVMEFAAVMKAKMKLAREKGKSGWDTDECSDEYLADCFLDHIHKGNEGTFEDCANFLMMLYQRNANPYVLVERYHKMLQRVDISK